MKGDRDNLCKEMEAKEASPARFGDDQECIKGKSVAAPGGKYLLLKEIEMQETFYVEAKERQSQVRVSLLPHAVSDPPLGRWWKYKEF